MPGNRIAPSAESSTGVDRRQTRGAKRKSPTTSLENQPQDAQEPSTKKAKAKAELSTPTGNEDAESLPSTLTGASLSTLLEQYPSYVPDELHALDTTRYETIPAAVQTRRAAAGSARGHGGDAKAGSRKGKGKGEQAGEGSGGADMDDEAKRQYEYGYMTKEEVVQLVEWKLKHGTFRPALLGMARAHPPELIQETTGRAFSQLLEAGRITDASASSALKTLCALRGIGPATASLLLSVAAPDEVPFFSDELFRWMMMDDDAAADKGTGKGKGKGQGWARKIGYTDREYAALRRAVEGLRDRMQGEAGAMDLEKVAYVLGKSAR